MKNEKGITMVSLVVYVIVMTLMLVVLSSVINNFYNNTDTVQKNVKEIVEFNKFNTYFLKEVKSNNNKVDHVSDNNDYILFKSGNSFSISNNTVYFNNIKICNGVKSLQFTLEQDIEDQDEEYSIVSVTLSFENFSKSIRYKLENIY